jgi:AraC-like DNA-binding protein
MRPQAVAGRLDGPILVESYRYEPGPAASLDRHTHEHHQLCFNPDYVGSVWIGGAWHVVPRGEVTLVSPGETHAVRDVDDRVRSGTYRVVYLEPATFGSTRFPVFPHAGGSLTLAFRALCAAADRPASTLERQERLLVLVGQLTTRFAGRTGPAPTARAPARLARCLLDERYRDNLSLVELARTVHLSPYHLLRVFRREYGLTPHLYQARVRVERAKRDIAAGATITRAAHDHGFHDASHLGRHFRQVVGVTPGRYRDETAPRRGRTVGRR